MKGTGMSESHEVMFYTDGRHTSVYLYEPPMGARQYVEPIDELLDLGIDTITYAVGDCSVLLYDTKVGERWGHNVDLTDHQIWYRAGIERRADDRVGRPTRSGSSATTQRSEGSSSCPTSCSTWSTRTTGGSRTAAWPTSRAEHPEWQVGPEPDYPEAGVRHPEQALLRAPGGAGGQARRHPRARDPTIRATAWR